MKLLAKKSVTRTYHVSKIFKAPLTFVYDWCTDFRADDYKLTGSKSRRKILEKTKKRVVYTVSYRSGGREMGHVSVVQLKPPNAWHLDTVGDEEEDEIGDYKLTSLGKSKTRLDMVFRMKYHNPKSVVERAEWEKDTSEFWAKLALHLHSDYNKNRA